MSRGAKRNLKRTQTRLLTDYYSGGTCYSSPVSSSVYELVNQLGKSNNDLLWYVICMLKVFKKKKKT
jgi:cell division control protein 45